MSIFIPLVLQGALSDVSPFGILPILTRISQTLRLYRENSTYFRGNLFHFLKIPYLVIFFDNFLSYNKEKHIIFININIRNYDNIFYVILL